MQFWLTTAVSVFLATCSANGLDIGVLNDTCGADEISELACMIKKLDEKLDNVIQLIQGSAQSSCKEIYEKGLMRENKAYTLNVEYARIPVYCHMEGDELGACGGGGWTLVMKIDGRKENFRYDAQLWTDKKGFNLEGGKTLLDYHETKLPTYWTTPFCKICLAMKIDNKVNSIVINKQANSLHSLIADGQHRPTTLGRDTWKKLIGQKASLQMHCNQEGFNCVSESDTDSRARIGIISNEQNDCGSCDSRIGFGTGGVLDDNTCGNEARYQADNGEKSIKAMGFILVQ